MMTLTTLTLTTTPYVGITGFTAADEIAAVVATLPEHPPRLLMCGVLLSNALLAGQPSGAPTRCPPPDAIAGIFSNDPRCLNLVHYRPRAGANLADALTQATASGGPNCHGVQINATRGAPWPEPASLDEYRRRAHPRRIVLQAGREAMASVSNNPDELAQRCANYAGIATDILIDASEGLGRPLNPTTTARYLTAIANAAPTLALATAGGLQANNLPTLLSPILPEWGHVSIDAEGQLRDDNDRLNVAAAADYLATAMGMLG